MAIAKRHLRQNRVISPKNVEDSYRLGRYDFEDFMNAPICFLQDGTLTEPAGTILIPISVNTGRYTYEFVTVNLDTMVSAGFVPLLRTAGGYDFVMTSDVVGAGTEVSFGGATRAGHPRNFIPRVTGGGGEDWFRRVLVLFSNVSGVDVTFGFRKVGAQVASLTEIIDVVGFRILGDSSSALAPITIVYNQNNEGTTDYTSATVGTNLTDAQVIELEVRSVGGYWQFFINGVRVNTELSIQADLDDEFVPIFRSILTTDAASSVAVLCTEGGPLSARSNELLSALAGTVA